MSERPPSPDDVYRDESGRLLLFVRTGIRPGRSVWSGAGPEDAEHHFVGVGKGGAVFDKWYMVDGRRPLPEGLDLVVNAGAEARIVELEAEVAELRAERAGLVEVMKLAVDALPDAVSRHLRQRYKAVRGEALTMKAQG